MTVRRGLLAWQSLQNYHLLRPEDFGTERLPARRQSPGTSRDYSSLRTDQTQ